MNQQLFLEMIDAAINGKTIDLSEVDEEFIRVAKEQTFLPFLYVASKDKKYKKYYIQSVLIHERINEVGKLIDNILNESKIPHIFLKGYELQNLYPDPNLRMMGDIDLIVKPEDFDKAKNKLQENSFQILDDDLHHLHMKKNNIEIELHHNLFEDTRYLCSYFSSPFDNATIIEKNNYSLNDNYNLIYLLGHYAKHLNEGEGIRPIIDIYFLIKKEKQFKIPSDIKKLNLDALFEMILSSIKIIFNEKIIDFKFNQYTQDFINYLFESGIHGKNNNLEQVTNNDVQKTSSKFKYLLSKLFCPISTLFKIYPWSKLIVTIPFAYFARLIHLIKTKKKKLKYALNSKEKNYSNMFKSIKIMSTNNRY